ncbi:tRNA lysidine(34) synthetase [Pectobacterium punjabense]|uniref:hypothetical protein n=1 Tax=Pectobacterium punjabense TaxID=2108399 RepID=UPI002406505C|nr:hypothetical protein [Pectobacterium punjabense]MDG0796063.1 hypothetical protein [Pectobacterium punjabense]
MFEKTTAKGNCPEISVVTAHGRQTLLSNPEDRLVDVLKKNSVPWSAVSIYQCKEDDQTMQLCSGLEKTLAEFGSDHLLLYFNRNVNPFKFLPENFKIIKSEDQDNESTEYIYQDYNNDQSTAQSYLKKLSPDECKDIIAARVAETIKDNIPQGSDLVVGVSGGGDSNALLHGLSLIRDHVNVHPVIIMGIPDWDKGVPRAQQLCDKYQLNLKVVEEGEVKNLLGIPADGESLINRFERNFQGDDFEFLGTLLIRLALSSYARQLGTHWISTGLNLEDVLCENFYRISNSLKPASCPVREIGDMKLIMPLWMCPKRIIDGCFPKYSLDNYDARYPCFSLGRNLYYSIVYNLQSSFPAFPEQLVHGLSLLASNDPVHYHLDEQLGFYVERMVPLALRHKFQRMLKDSIGPSIDQQSSTVDKT